MKLEFSRQILEKLMKVHPVGPELFHWVKRTDG